MVFATAAALAAVPASHAQTGCQPAWSAVGSGVGGGEFPTVSALAVFDDGLGPALYAGGRFTMAGGIMVNGVAKWDGAAWSPLGSGVDMSCPAPCPEPAVTALAVFDDGSGAGPALYAGGVFDTAGGAPANCIAKWDGAAWSPLGSGTNSTVFDLAVFDDGSGPALYVAGQFFQAGGLPAAGIAKWDGAAWSVPGGGVGGTLPWVYALTEFDDGSGPALYGGGSFEAAGGVPASRMAKWDGVAWSPLADGGTFGPVYALTVFDDGSGPALYAGGQFIAAGGVPASRIAKWDGAEWSLLGSGVEGGDAPRVFALTVFDDGAGAGPALYAGGQFMTAGGVTANSVARWNGAAWSALDSGMGGGDLPGLGALAVFDDGAGAGAALYAGGQFTAAGGVSANNIAKWGCEACYADCDGDSDLTFFDFLCFQNEFAATTPYADCDGSGGHDFFDFLCFQNAFAAGCE
jgi:hypothetical protein